MPAGVKARLDLWLTAAGVTEGRIFQPVNKGGEVRGDKILNGKVIRALVVRYAQQTDLG
ncbi:MAG: hypothetical protein ACRYFU_11555 [Janthinobacterium lividum]